MADAVRYGLLDEPLLSIADAAGRHVERLSLPALYAALVRGAVGDFPAVRPHQRHVWHAFLVQVGALALHGAGLTEPPDDAGAWRALLLALTPGDPDGAAWALVAPHARPALLQPPVPGGDVSGFKSVRENDPITTPDALDMLVTSKNHDVKQEVIAKARPEHWVYALVSLQTQEGYGGATKHGVSRMNSGKGNRPGVGVVPLSGPGARFTRDVLRLLALRDRILQDYPAYLSNGGSGLLWLIPWDGTGPLRLAALDPFFVEVCRRVRLVKSEDHLHAIETGSASKAEVGKRVGADALRGNLGDPWTPVVTDEHGPKAYTLSAPGYTYSRVRSLVLPTANDKVRRAPLQIVADTDADEGIALVARGLIRGDVTEGYHERYIPVSKVLRRFFAAAATDEAAAIAQARVGDVATFVGEVLRPALRDVYTGAPRSEDRSREKDKTVDMRVARGVSRFDSIVDQQFFPDLEAELAVLGDHDTCEVERGRWLLHLRDLGRAVLDDVLATAPTAAMRHHRTRVRARRRFEGAFRHRFGERIPATPATPPAGAP